MDQGRKIMGFYREPFVGGLHVITASCPPDLIGKQDLLFITAEMFNCRVAVGYVKGFIPKREMSAIRYDNFSFYVLIRLFASR